VDVVAVGGGVRRFDGGTWTASATLGARVWQLVKRPKSARFRVFIFRKMAVFGPGQQC